MTNVEPMPGDMLFEDKKALGTVFDVVDDGKTVKYHSGSNVSGWVPRAKLILVEQVERHFFNIWEIEHGG